MGPVEGWVAVLDDGSVFIVKGCEHPLPCLYVVPKRLGRIRVKDAWMPTRFYRWSLCLGDAFNVLCPWEYSTLIDPVEHLESMLARGFRDEVVEYLRSAASRVGVTGSLVYEQWRARDIDIVVYGVRDSLNALKALLDLWAEGRLEPIGSREYQAARREFGPGDWVAVATYNPLYFRVRGREYSVKLVACTDPKPCKPSRRVWLWRRVVVERGLGAPCTIPRYYRVRGARGEAILYTLRSSLACLPQGSILEGLVAVEEGEPERLVPDGGVIRVHVLQA